MARPLYAIGDVHGDAERLIHILTSHGIVSVNGDQLVWTKPGVIVLLMGDVPDARSRHGSFGDKVFENTLSDLWMMEFLRAAAKEAEKVNAKLLAILGNHELMNYRGDMQYASPHHCKNPSVRQDYFSTGGGRETLETLYHTSVTYNGVHYSHAGIPLAASASQNKMLGKKVSAALLRLAHNEQLEDLLSHRDYHERKVLDADDIARVEQICRQHNCSRMVIGHNYTDGMGVVSSFGGRVVYSDVGISRAFTPQRSDKALEIVYDPGDGDLKVLHIDGRTSAIEPA